MLYLNKNLTLESNCPLKEARVGLLGVPFDSTSTYRVGSRNAPLEIRKEFYELEKEDSFFETKFCDAGNVDVVHGNTQETLKRVEDSIKSIIQQNRKIVPIALGGEHTITYPIVKTLTGEHGKITVVNIDAHMDLKDDYIGEKWCHATVMRRISELEINLKEIGVRSFLQEEEKYAKKRGVDYCGIEESQIRKILGRLKGRKVYITLDFDAITPEIASVVSNPEPDGLKLNQVHFIFNSLIQHCTIVGIDIVEVNPLYDKTATSVTAARLLLDVIQRLAV